VFTAQERSALLYTERNYESRKLYLTALALVPEERRVYVDETGFDAPLIREYGYARRGKKLHGERTGKRYERTSLIAGLKGG
jgi:putative transposase